jgi:ATP/maltotriose-dependent transcriptional regulator MalT
MKLLSIIVCLVVTLISAQAFGADAASKGALSEKGKNLSEQCNLEARNSLVSDDLVLVEKVCTQAVEEMEKSGADKKYQINPLMNMGVALTFSGQYEKALTYYKRAQVIGEKVYGPGSSDLKQIEETIKKHEDMKAHQNKKMPSSHP